MSRSGGRRGEGSAPKHVPGQHGPRSACLLDGWDEKRQGLACACAGLADHVLPGQAGWDGRCLHISAVLVLHHLGQRPAPQQPFQQRDISVTDLEVP